ncbi:hypothetical protein DL96DRAFT_1817274 [Flagelloscypha sp. PMI_526]|nr:hypothetical protein DL96DRAFT_1817274 [Flagelloscypha sp. PMI_526]
MTSTQSFPYDLIVATFAQCDEQTLSAACRTSRVLFDDTCNLLYERVCLERQDVERFLQAMPHVHRIKHLALIDSRSNDKPNEPWFALLLAVREKCKLASFKLLQGIYPSSQEDFRPYVEAILKMETLRYVATHTSHVSIPLAVQAPVIKELEIDSPYGGRKIFLSLRILFVPLCSHYRLKKLAICRAYRYDATSDDILDLLRETAPTLEELSFWFYFNNDIEFLHQSVELPNLRALVLSDSVEQSCRFATQHFPMLNAILPKAPRLEEVRLYCQWVDFGEIASDLLEQLPRLPDFSPQIKRLVFEFSESYGNSLDSELVAAEEMMRRKWGENRELRVSIGNQGSWHLTSFCEALDVASSREIEE